MSLLLIFSPPVPRSGLSNTCGAAGLSILLTLIASAAVVGAIFNA